MTGTEQRVRAWCLTQHYVTVEERITHESILKTQKGVVYLIVGREICPSTGRKHLQIYIHFKNDRSFSVMKKKFPTAHLEPAKGTADENRDYCGKEGDSWEVGTPPKQGKRNDIDKIKETLNSGGRMRDIVQIATSVQSVRMAEIHLKYLERKRNWKPTVKWYWGPTGTGKSHRAHEECDDPFDAHTTIKWWEGYDAHDTVIIDDMRGDFCKFHELLKLLDKYPFLVECKGGSRQLLAKTIIITSCYHPKDMFSTREDIAQLYRRIDVIKKFPYPGKYPMKHLEAIRSIN